MSSADIVSALLLRVLDIGRHLESAVEAQFGVMDELRSISFRLGRLIIHSIGVGPVLSAIAYDAFLSALQDTRRCLEGVLSSAGELVSTGYTAPLEQASRFNGCGRPRFSVTKEQLEYFLSMGFRYRKVAEMLGVSLRTVRRRMTEYGLSVGDLYSQITDQALDAEIRDILRMYPNSSYLNPSLIAFCR